MIRGLLPLCVLVVAFHASALAALFGAARGVVHDPEHRPMAGAMVVLKAANSDWSRTMQSGPAGEFLFLAVPLGEYSITVSAGGFAPTSQQFAVESSSEPVLHLQMQVAGASTNVEVAGDADRVATTTAHTTTTISRLDIAATPGATRSNSLAMITNFVPGSYVTHDQLHVRGGHQISWLIDGVAIPNTNIASNLGPQFDPKDIDYLETSRGGYGAELGDRTYGVFNIVPRTGFERDRQAELTLSAGNFYQTNDEFSLGSHTQRFAYYGSLNGNRSNLGIQTPVPQTVHDAANGYGGFGSIIYNVDAANQLRVVTSMRRDYYQIPYDPNSNDVENNPANGQYPSLGLRDGDHESDVLLNASWVHTFSSRLLLTASPFFHYNRADYAGSLLDKPVITTENRGSSYVGGQVTLDATLPRNHVQVGSYNFYQRDSEAFGVVANDGSTGVPYSTAAPTGTLAAFFVDDSFKATPWLTLSLGLRPTFFSGGVTESAISPRVSAAVTLPRLNWSLRAFYGHYYQAPPLISACNTNSGLCQALTANQLSFTPLHGERDEEYQFGVNIPVHGWVLDADTFRNRVVNFFDHNNIGESNLFFPVTIQAALIRAWELTLRSPRIAGRGQLHLAYSNQIATGGGVVTGGLNDALPTPPTWPVQLTPLDHDQRNTLDFGGDVLLPERSHAGVNVYYGSGFSNAFTGQPYPGNYLPAHTTFDLSFGKQISESTSVSVTAMNVANRRVELDNSLTFGGFHWNSPRELFAEVRYRFKY